MLCDDKSFASVLLGNGLFCFSVMLANFHDFVLIDSDSSQKELDSVADQDAILVPIRLEIDTDDFRLRDTFTWNVNEQLMTPENFAEILCEDLDLNMAKYVPDIVASIRSQIAEFEPIAEVQVPSEGARAVIQVKISQMYWIFMLQLPI